MLKSNPHLPTDLPQQVRWRLDPKLAELYSQIPSVVASRSAALVRAALPCGIRPNRLLKYAFLHASAEQLTRGNEVSKQHRVRSKAELAGALHGFDAGYSDMAEAKRRYRQGRRARQQVKASFEAAVKSWRGFEAVAQRHRSELPKHLQSRLSDEMLHTVRRRYQSMGIAIVIDEEDLLSEEASGRELSERAQTYIWWRFVMAPYRGKWNDMHKLASTWKMSPAASVRNFRTAVDRMCKRPSVIVYPFGKAWDSVLSEDS
jgi:hypothetical protein